MYVLTFFSIMEDDAIQMLLCVAHPGHVVPSDDCPFLWGEPVTWRQAQTGMPYRFCNIGAQFARDSELAGECSWRQTGHIAADNSP